jgi:hypothetical protein
MRNPVNIIATVGQRVGRHLKRTAKSAFLQLDGGEDGCRTCVFERLGSSA